MSEIKTTAGEVFSESDSANLAYTIYRRFGYELPVAAAAWRRMLQNSCTDEQFKELLRKTGNPLWGK